MNDDLHDLKELIKKVAAIKLKRRPNVVIIRNPVDAPGEGWNRLPPVHIPLIDYQTFGEDKGSQYSGFREVERKWKGEAETDANREYIWTDRNGELRITDTEPDPSEMKRF